MPTATRTKSAALRIGAYDVPVSNLDKPLWPGEGITKGDLLEYYINVWPWLGPHLLGRPVSLVRYPHGVSGECFYHKDFPDAPAWVERTAIRSEGRVVTYCMANNLATIVWSVNLGCVEVHPWLSRVGCLDRPTYVIFDLDPMAPAGFAEAVEVAQAISILTQRLALVTFPKVSGATGVHIYLPIKPRYTFEQTSTFVRRLGEIVVLAMPSLATAERAVKRREGKVYIDHLQNLRGKTIASAYSVRPFPGAPVSVPCTWDELPQLRPDSFTVRTAPARFGQVGDLFQGLLGLEQDLPEDLLL